MSIIVANSNPDSARRVAAVLKQSGLPVTEVCFTGAQMIEVAMRRYQGGVVVSSLDLPDMAAVKLPKAAPRSFEFLFLVRSHQTGMAEQLDCPRLLLPLNRRDLVDSVRMLNNLFLPGRRDVPPNEGPALVDAAKQLLMERNRFTESQAHRFLQRKSMDTGRRNFEIAAIVLEKY